VGDQGCSNFQRNKQRQRPSYTRASAHPLANAKHKGETELRTNTGHQSTQHHQQQFANLAQKSALTSAFCSLTTPGSNTAEEMDLLAASIAVAACE
jgi:hypothetical protein